MRKPKMVATVLLASGVFAFAASQGGNSAAQKVDHWSRATAAVVKLDSGHRVVATADLPQPPADSVLKEASNEGYAVGLEMDALAEQLGRDIAEASGADLDETLESFHEVVCLAFIWYLEQRVTPEDPAEMEVQIGRYLAVSHFPARELPRIGRDLEALYKMARHAASIGKLQAEVADAVLC